MLRVYHSNRLDVLEALMEFIVERERLDDPFEPEMVLVQSTGMAQWLQMSLSRNLALPRILISAARELYLGDVCPRVAGYPGAERLQQAKHELEADGAAAGNAAAR
jgi:hypothetical protein